MFRYAQINKDNLCVCDSWLAEEVHQDDMIPIPDDMESPLGWTYNNGEWIAPPPPPAWEKDLIDEESEAQLEMQTNIQYLVDLMEMNMEV